VFTRDDIKADLAGRIAKAMYMRVDELDEDQLFSDFGLESVTLAKIIVGIRERYGCHVTVGELLVHQTLREAAELVHTRVSARTPEAPDDPTQDAAADAAHDGGARS
jgi:acyl carrier protein